MTGHANLSPSSASRWIACPGSVPASAGIQDKTSVHAEEGTRAHELAAYLLMGSVMTTQEIESRPSAGHKPGFERSAGAREMGGSQT